MDTKEKNAALPYRHPLFQRLSGGAWRPGGLALTVRALDTLDALHKGSLSLPPASLVLDVGCGGGATLEALRARGWRALGVDRDWACVLAASKAGHAALCADAARLPLAARSVDALLCECVLSLVNEADVLAGFAHVLRPGGALLLADIYVRNEELAPGQGTAQGCLGGAVSRKTTEQRLATAGFSLLHFEDHSAALRQLAAQLLWHGADKGELARWLGVRCGEAYDHRYNSNSDSLNNSSTDSLSKSLSDNAHDSFDDRLNGGAKNAFSRYGYGLWLARKEGP